MRLQLACGHTTFAIPRKRLRMIAAAGVGYCPTCRGRYTVTDKRSLAPGQPSRANVSRRIQDPEEQQP